MSDPTRSFRIPEHLRELLESRSRSTGVSVTAIILEALREFLGQPVAAPEPGALERAVLALIDDAGDVSQVDRQGALVLSRIGDQAAGIPSVTAVRELRGLLENVTDSQDAEIAAFRRQLAAAVDSDDAR